MTSVRGISVMQDAKELSPSRNRGIENAATCRTRFLAAHGETSQQRRGLCGGICLSSSDAYGPKPPGSSHQCATRAAPEGRSRRRAQCLSSNKRILVSNCDIVRSRNVFPDGRLINGRDSMASYRGCPENHCSQRLAAFKRPILRALG